MKSPWSLSHSAWSLGWLSALLAWIKVTYLRCLSFFSASVWMMPYTISEKFSEGMITLLEVWNLVVSQLWEDRLQWDNRMPFGQFGQSHRSLWFILCEIIIMSHLINEIPCGPNHLIGLCQSMDSECQLIRQQLEKCMGHVERRIMD